MQKRQVNKGISSSEEQNNIKIKTSENESSKQELRFVDINNIVGSKLDLDANDLKSFEKSKSRITSASKKNQKSKLNYSNNNNNYNNNVRTNT